MNVSGSVGLTPYSRLDNERVSASAPAMPMATPISVSLVPSPITVLKTSPFCAPSAMRIPISRTRRRTP